MVYRSACGGFAGFGVLAVLALLALDAAALELQPKIYDIKLGTPVGMLPVTEWVDPACGTNGGPRGGFIQSFENFAKCPKEADTGLHEIWFQYDDEDELAARALRDPHMIGVYAANQLFNQPIIMSLLVDDQGLVQGYRVFNDNRAPPAQRIDAHIMGRPMVGLSGLDEASCSDIAPLPGERPVYGVFEKRYCRGVVNGIRATIESKLFLKPGQNLIDPVTQEPYPNAFESSARMELVVAAALSHP